LADPGAAIPSSSSSSSLSSSEEEEVVEVAVVSASALPMQSFFPSRVLKGELAEVEVEVEVTAR
jgi:hypothetical protein